MQVSIETRVRRIQRWLRAAAVIRDPSTELGRRARLLLTAATGLSEQNVDFGLHHAFEFDAPEPEIAAMCRSTPLAARAHVVLSPSVFVAPLRAIAIGLCCSRQVLVKPSRRDPVMVDLLREAAPGWFEVESRLHLSRGDHVWAYGSDETLDAIQRDMPEGSYLHRHGTGFGLVVLDESIDGRIGAVTAAVASDVAAFDQRGCLSPRLVLIQGPTTLARRFVSSLADALATVEIRLPRGALNPQERAAIVRYRDTACFVGEVSATGSGFVGLDLNDGPLIIPPVGRVLHVVRTSRPAERVREVARYVTTVALECAPQLTATIAALLPGARLCRPASMQRPPFDGPVDRRTEIATVIGETVVAI